MGKGVIISDDGEGLYQVEVKFNRGYVENRQAKLEKNIEALEEQFITTIKYIDRQVIQLKITSCQKEIAQLNTNIPDDYTTAAWCADLTEELSGDVGTIEVPGEVGNIQVQPGFSGGSPYNKGRDGQLTPTMGQPASGAFYNLAMLPGWQKWKPLFRYATIDSIDSENDTADITLDAAKSSQQNLNINQTATLSGVDVDYMDCNAGAFEEGDAVLVLFDGQDWGNPKIIGFKEEPKPCSSPFFIRPSFNGEYAEKGSEELVFTLPFLGPQTVKVYGADFPPPPEYDLEEVVGLVGPFEMDASQYDEFIEGESIDVKLADKVGAYFSAHEMREADVTRPIDTISTTSPLAGAPPTRMDIYHSGVRVENMLATSKLLDSDPEDITVNEKEYKCFNVDFTDLKMLKATYIGDPASTYLPQVNARDFGLEVNWQQYFDPEDSVVNVAFKSYFSVQSGPYHLFARTDPDYGDMYWTSWNCSAIPYGSGCGYGCCYPEKLNYWYGVNTSEEYALSRYIITDEKGHTPQHFDATWYTDIRITSQILLISENGSTYDYIDLSGPGMTEVVDGYPAWRYIDTVGYTFTMINTPKDRF